MDCLLLVKLKCIYYLVIGDRFIASSIFIDWYTVWPHLPIMIINSIMSLKIQYYLSMHFRCILFKQRGEKLSLLFALVFNMLFFGKKILLNWKEHSCQFWSLFFSRGNFSGKIGSLVDVVISLFCVVPDLTSEILGIDLNF